MDKFQKVTPIKGKSFLFCVERSDNPEDYEKYEKLRNEIWAEPSDNLAGPRNLLCENYFHEGTSLFISVYVEDTQHRFKKDYSHFIGFSYGYVGTWDKKVGFRSPSNLFFYSQYTGVKENFRNYGLGIFIKQFQKEVLKNIWGIYNITCTYDPLTGVNAYRNIHRFGMEVEEYRKACYGEFGGNLNRVDIPCDRFYLCWDLKKDIKRPSYNLPELVDSGCMAVSSKLKQVKGKNGLVSLEVLDQVNPRLHTEFQLVEIPFDFYRMLRETDVGDKKVREIPLQWRMETRKIFQNLLEKNYKIIDFISLTREKRKRDFYVLKK